MTDNKFMIGGEIIFDDAQRIAFEDVTPAQVRSVISKLGKGDGITFEISSPGGNVVAGLAIADLIKAASLAGHPCKAHVVGIAASMASVIACACDEIEIDESAFMMIHNPLSQVEGNAEQLRKEADLLDKMRDSILAFYRSKFDKSDDELIALMDAETWFTGAECEEYGFKAKVIPNAAPLKAAACARQIPAFAKIPETAAGLFVLGKHEEAQMNEIKIEAENVSAENAPETPVETPAPETSNDTPAPAEAPVDASTPAETPAEESKTETVPLAECEKRVSGMQSAMAKQIDQLRADYEAKLADIRDTSAAAETNFKNQLAAKDEELTKVRAEVTRLADAVKKAEGELQETASALAVKENALAVLNASVNAPAPVASYKEQMAKAKTPEEREALRARKRKGEFN